MTPGDGLIVSEDEFLGYLESWNLKMDQICRQHPLQIVYWKTFQLHSPPEGPAFSRSADGTPYIDFQLRITPLSENPDPMVQGQEFGYDIIPHPSVAYGGASKPLTLQQSINRVRARNM